ncbi:MAG TPA: RnfABCDGE type electron transport complex subunit D [Oscillospiraceae bacterium]|nr:RnfABCDGE type electron transport complex subunit D [Oscillospiraceae bacterium]
MGEKTRTAALKELNNEPLNLPTVSASPHMRSRDTTTGIMLDVIVALIPSLIAAAALFGLRALAVTGVSVLSCLIFEYISRKVMKRNNTLNDLSAVVTGILLAFNLPSSIPFWMVIIGAFIAIVIVKQFFGGIGHNFVNPALIGRIILMSSFPTAMTTWTGSFVRAGADAVSSATPLASLSEIFIQGDFSEASFSTLPSNLSLFFGQTGGGLGETCSIAILIGMIYLIARRVISPIIPLTYIGSVALIMLIAGGGNISFLIAQILSGGLLLGAVFMATDYTTSPTNSKGKFIYAIGCGVITSIIRLYGNLPEGVSFAIILMNILTPLIDYITKPKPFGYVKQSKKEKEAAN